MGVGAGLVPALNLFKISGQRRGKAIMSEISIKIDGMSCQHCVNNVKKAIDSLSGIVSSDVTKGLAIVVIDEDTISKVKIENAIVDAGYKIID